MKIPHRKVDKSIESFESLLPAFVTCSQKLRLGSTTHLEISEAHLRSVSHFLGLRKILPPPSTNAAIPQVRVEEKIKSLGFCSDIYHIPCNYNITSLPSRLLQLCNSTFPTLTRSHVATVKSRKSFCVESAVTPRPEHRLIEIVPRSMTPAAL